jgi:hypothetical protein
MGLTEEEQEILTKALKKQMDRIAKIMGYNEAWFSSKKGAGSGSFLFILTILDKKQ